MAIIINIKAINIDSTFNGKIEQIFSRHIRERCGESVVFKDNAPLTLSFEIKILSEQEGFEILSDSDHKIRFIGDNFRSLLYGLGKFLHTSTFQKCQFVPSSWRGKSIPETTVRSVYFATHFFNFYHAAPIEKITEYIEDLALWGFNLIIVWYDMHHFHGINDPAATRFIERLRVILSSAKAINLQIGLTLLANEGYGNSPKKLRADQSFPGTRHIRGGYGVELCPSKLDAKKLILQWLSEEFDAFSSLSPEYIMIWPYDQGGCCCPQCRPWGSNGFPRIAKEIATLARQLFPKIKVVLSTWLLDPKEINEGEWEGLTKLFNSMESAPDWLDFILADSHTTFPHYPLQQGVPGNLPLLNFPEISMWNMGPWGGYGANPGPDRFQRQWDAISPHLSGGIIYSEGIFEDINKVIWGQFYWKKGLKQDEILREYVSYEFPGCNIEEIMGAIQMLEKNHHEFSYRKRRKQPTETEDSSAIYQSFQKNQDFLPEYIRTSWRWRILYLRAMLDYERFRNPKYPDGNSQAAFEELSSIYHAQNAEPSVHPPIVHMGGSSLFRNLFRKK